MQCNEAIIHGLREAFDIHATSDQSSFLHINEREEEKLVMEFCLHIFTDAL
jgi:hypothetical protein